MKRFRSESHIYFRKKIRLISTSKATVPPTQGIATGDTIEVPVPPYVNGDLMLLIVAASAFTTLPPPVPQGWTLEIKSGDSNGLYVYSKKANNEPSSYTVEGVGMGNSCGGFMLIYRNAIIGQKVASTARSTFPQIRSTRNGAVFLGLSFYYLIISNSEQISAISPLNMIVQHANVGNVPYIFAVNIGAASRENLVVGETYSELTTFHPEGSSDFTNTISLVLDVS